jgi:hypothetical protein
MLLVELGAPAAKVTSVQCSLLALATARNGWLQLPFLIVPLNFHFHRNPSKAGVESGWSV